MGKYFRWGLVGNTLIYGGSLACVGYVGWILWDLNENHSVKMSTKLFKETFEDVTQEDYNEIIRRGKAKEMVKQKAQQVKQAKVSVTEKVVGQKDKEYI